MDINAPKNFQEALKLLVDSLSVEQKIKLMEKTEAEFTADAHLLFGANLRNAWGLWQPDAPLTQYFKSVGIDHPDNMSDILIRSAYRVIMGQSVDLPGQLEKYKRL